MKETFRLKTWAGPLTIGSFIVMSVSGIMMFFHWNVGMVKVAHEWLGWLFVIGAVAHLVVNWGTFLAYFRKPAGLGIMAVLLGLGALSLLPAGGGRPHGPPFMAVSKALEQSPLNVVAQVAKRSPQSVTDTLGARGIRVRHEAQTISEIASDNNKQSMEILAYVIGNANQSARSPTAQ